MKREKLFGILLSLTLAFVISLLPGIGLTAWAQDSDLYIPIDVKGFDKDIIIDSQTNAESTVNSTVGFVTDYAGNQWAKTFYSSSCKSEGAIPSGVVTTTTGKQFNIQSSTGNNVVQVYKNKSATLTFSGNDKYESLAILSSGGNGNSNIEVTINYSDNTADKGDLFCRDWCAWSSYNDDDYTIVKKLDGINCGGEYLGRNESGLYENTIKVDSNKTIRSITFSFISGNDDGTIANIFAVSGVIKRENKITVSFDSKEGSPVASQTIVKGGTATEPSKPTKNGVPFLGWSDVDGSTSYYDFNTPVTSDLKLYAQWGTGITNIELDKTELTLANADSQTLTASVTPEDAGDKTVTWASSDPFIAEVDVNGKVTAKAEGTATITATATNGTEDTDDDKTASCSVTVNKAVSVVTTPPEAKTGLTYTSSEQELVTKGVASGGEVQYAIGTDDKTAPTIGWGTSIPTGTEAGTYYVWYKAAGDESHTDSEPKCLTVTISKENQATVTKDPEAKTDLTYTGSEQELLTGGEASDGVMQYAIGTDDKTAPTTGWGTSISTGTDVGTYYVWYKAVGDKSHTDSEPKCIEVTISEAPADLTVQIDNLKQDASRGVPSEIKDQEVEMTITIKSDTAESKTVKPVKLTVSAGDVTVTEQASFDKSIKDLGPGKQTVIVSVTPKSVVDRDTIRGAEGGKYELSAKGEINEVDGKMIVRVYLIWDNGSRPEPIRVVALPEDEIGAYKLNADGTKEYLLFHTYDICMKWLGSDELCRGYERCFHKENAFVNPFVKP